MTSSESTCFSILSQNCAISMGLRVHGILTSPRVLVCLINRSGDLCKDVTLNDRGLTYIVDLSGLITVHSSLDLDLRRRKWFWNKSSSLSRGIPHQYDGIGTATAALAGSRYHAIHRYKE